MPEYARKSKPNPEVREFKKYSIWNDQLAEAHTVLAWALRRKFPRTNNRTFGDYGPKLTGTVAAPENMRDVSNTTVSLWNADMPDTLFVAKPDQFIVWENAEFRVYEPKQFSDLFDPLPEVTEERFTERPSGLAIQRDGA